jgi:hypothetical protein
MPAAPSRSGFLSLRFRIALALLSALAALDIGLALQDSWARADHAKDLDQRGEAINKILANVERTRQQISEINRRADVIASEALKQRAEHDAAPAEPAKPAQP